MGKATSRRFLLTIAGGTLLLLFISIGSNISTHTTKINILRHSISLGSSSSSLEPLGNFYFGQARAREHVKRAYVVLRRKVTEVPRWELCGSRITNTYWFDNINVVYTGIPKSGCSNWISSFVEAAGRLPPQLKEKDAVTYIHGKITSKDRLIHRSLENLQELNKLDEKGKIFSMIVLRNPWTRLVSGYRDKISDESKTGPSLKALSLHIYQKLHPGDPGAMELTPKESHNDGLFVSFAEFVAFLLESRSSNVHFKPQTEFLCAHSDYSYVGALELSDYHAREVFSLLKLNSSVTQPYDQSSDPRLSHTTEVAKALLSSLPQTVIDKFYERYKADFLLLNYSNFTDPNFPLPLVR